jgi:Rod binding domain-containing protein
MPMRGIETVVEMNQAGTAPSPRLVRAAHEFEGQMMKELLKPMTAGDALTGEDGDSGDSSSGALGEFASEALGQALSDRGGFGIADRIVKELTYANTRRETREDAGSGHTNSGMRTSE